MRARASVLRVAWDTVPATTSDAGDEGGQAGIADSAGPARAFSDGDFRAVSTEWEGARRWRDSQRVAITLASLAERDHAAFVAIAKAVRAVAVKTRSRPAITVCKARSDRHIEGYMVSRPFVIALHHYFGGRTVARAIVVF